MPVIHSLTGSVIKKYLRCRAASDMTREGDIYSRTSKDESLWDQYVGFASKISGRNVVPHFVVKPKNKNKYRGLFVNYLTQKGKGGPKYLNYD